MTKDAIHTPDAPAAIGPYSQAVRAGNTLYLSGRSADAETLFVKATEIDPNDARSWYFLGLARLSGGKRDADTAFRRGADLEARGLTSPELIGTALERVQGPARQVLTAYRP